jgi:hypothetical protein
MPWNRSSCDSVNVFHFTEIPIYVHEEEFKHACWAVATGADFGVYLGQYMHAKVCPGCYRPASVLELFFVDIDWDLCVHKMLKSHVHRVTT